MQHLLSQLTSQLPLMDTYGAPLPQMPTVTGAEPVPVLGGRVQQRGGDTGAQLLHCSAGTHLQH
jgi:hypothetical protein